ncbi:MAG: hypothetical protein ABW185_21335 [Sedimenticola sp.]
MMGVIKGGEKHEDFTGVNAEVIGVGGIYMEYNMFNQKVNPFNTTYLYKENVCK